MVAVVATTNASLHTPGFRLKRMIEAYISLFTHQAFTRRMKPGGPGEESPEFAAGKNEKGRQQCGGP
jgi:hypothetical protein